MTIRFRITATIGLAVSAFALPAVAHAKTGEPVMLAMSSYAASTAGEDAVIRAAKKQQAYEEHRKKHAADAHDKGDCKECADCPDCADCDKVAEAKAGVCDPAAHAKTKVKFG